MSLTQKVHALRKLKLPNTFEPTAKIAERIGIELEEIIGCLQTSQDENALSIVAFYNRLNRPQRKAIDIDYLIAAAGCKDPFKMFGLIAETYGRVKAAEAQMIASQAAPEVMRHTARHARYRDGFQHAKLLLQTTGVAPTPVNQKNILIGNKIDNSRNMQVNVQTHKGIVDDVSTILQSLPGVSPAKNPPEDRSHRTGEKDQAG